MRKERQHGCNYVESPQLGTCCVYDPLWWRALAESEEGTLGADYYNAKTSTAGPYARFIEERPINEDL